MARAGGTVQWILRLLFWSALSMQAVTGEEDVASAAGGDPEVTVGYWEATLHGGSMPSTIRAMLSPLTTHQTTQLLLHINNASTGYLPSHAASFCKAAHIRCGPPASASASASASSTDPEPLLFHYIYRKAAPALQAAKLPTSKPELPFAYNYRRADPSKPELPFAYNYRRAAPALRIPASTASDPQPLFIKSNYRKAAPALQKANIPRAALDPNTFNMFTSYNKAPLASHARQSPTSDPDTTPARVLMSTTVHEIPGTFFRQEQVLVSGVTIHVNHAANNSLEKDDRAFLPRKLAELFPLFVQGAKQISIMLGVSKEALQVTIDGCNVLNDMNAEVAACLTSLEDVSDFVSSVMGSTKPIYAYESLLNASTVKFSGKTFYVQSVEALKQDPNEPSVTCHDLAFPFRVFYCHYAKKTMLFYVSLRAKDGTSHKRIAVCHYDTSNWDPDHVSFAELHTKPGEAEACHWLSKSWMGQNGWAFAHA